MEDTVFGLSEWASLTRNASRRKDLAPCPAVAMSLCLRASVPLCAQLSCARGELRTQSHRGTETRSPVCYPARVLRRGLIIAIDGPTAAGKSTAGKALAARLGYIYIDSGAMYRAVGLAALDAGTSLDDADALSDLAGRVEVRVGGDPHAPSISLDGRDVSALIRTPEVDAAASKVSVVPGVRAAMVAQQQAMGRDGGVVMDGRDIGTHVFPDADVKIFMQADTPERARRRYEENLDRGAAATLDATRQAIEDRDERDRSREAAPLRAAPDAIMIDTTSLTREALLERLLELVQSRL